MAQETLQEKEGPRCGEPIDPLDLSGPETDREGEDDPEIRFLAREPEELVTSPRRAQEAIDCDIVNMVKTLNSQRGGLHSRRRLAGYRLDLILILLNDFDFTTTFLGYRLDCLLEFNVSLSQ